MLGNLLTSQTWFFTPPATSNHLFITGTRKQFIERLHTVDPSAPSCSSRTPSVHLTSRETFTLHREPPFTSSASAEEVSSYIDPSATVTIPDDALLETAVKTVKFYSKMASKQEELHTPTTLATLLSIIVDENRGIYRQISSCSNLNSLRLNLCNLDKLRAICYSPTT